MCVYTIALKYLRTATASKQRAHVARGVIKLPRCQLVKCSADPRMLKKKIIHQSAMHSTSKVNGTRQRSIKLNFFAACVEMNNAGETFLRDLHSAVLVYWAFCGMYREFVAERTRRYLRTLRVILCACTVGDKSVWIACTVNEAGSSIINLRLKTILVDVRFLMCAGEIKRLLFRIAFIGQHRQAHVPEVNPR